MKGEWLIFGSQAEFFFQVADFVEDFFDGEFQGAYSSIGLSLPVRLASLCYRLQFGNGCFAGLEFCFASKKVSVGFHTSAAASREFFDERAVWILDEAL